MLHRSTAFRDEPDTTARAELEFVGLGDPSESLRRRAFSDLFLIATLYVVFLLLALALDLGDRFHEFVIRYEKWEVDEFIIAGVLSLIAFTGFSLRQWYRYSSEIDRRLKLERDLVEMRVLVDHFGENKALFLSNLAHDFRTPLNGILGFAQLLQEEPFGPIGNDHYKNYIATIRESAIMLNDRITTCLDPDKIEFGAEPMQMMPFPLKQAIANALPVVQAMAQSADIGVEDDVPENLPDIHGDRRAIKKVIINLATNAIKHCQPKGKVRLSASASDDGTLAIEVEDNGVGMDARIITALLRHEAGADHAGATEDGQGVGLFVVKKLLDMHEATLTIDNRLGNGTVVTVTFPKNRIIPKT
jgi:signal transduction histidine kinase